LVFAILLLISCNATDLINENWWQAQAWVT